MARPEYERLNAEVRAIIEGAIDALVRLGMEREQAPVLLRG
jgi:hypothetical protein